MPKTKKVVARSTAKSTKEKLTPEQRSQVAKDRWAKRREAVGVTNRSNAEKITVTWPEPGTFTVSTQTPVTNSSSVVTTTGPTLDVPVPNEIAMDNLVMQELKGKDDALVATVMESTPPASPESIVVTPSPYPAVVTTSEVKYPPTATQLTPVAPKKQKRYTGPKEFSVALKTAEGRLAKAITDRAEYAGKLAALQAEIPSLLQIIAALKGPQNFASPAQYDTPVSYDLSLGIPNATAFQAPITQQYTNPLLAIQQAQVQPPVSRATGGAMQFTPDMVGTLEGPEDDMDKFITGPAAGGSGWIGG